MEKRMFILENNEGETVRVVKTNSTAKNFEVVYRKDLRRVDIVENSEELKEAGLEFVILGEIPNKGAGDNQLLLKGDWGQVRSVEAVKKYSHDVPEKKEDEKRDILFFLKWSSGVQIAGLALILLISFIVSKFQTEELEPQVVKVFKREDIKQKTPIVAMSEKKILNVKRENIFKRNQNKTAKKVAVRTTGKTQGNSTRSGAELSQMGALSAFGGMSKNSTGLGGLSNKASKSSGYAFDSNRARGGSDRGLLGKGLVQAGIGSGESAQGYGGFGKSGMGQGQAASGVMGRAGQGGGHYLPMSEDAVIEGGLDRDQVNAVVQRNFMQVRYCYEKGLQTKSSLSGRVSVHFIISPSGSVSLAKIDNTSLDSKQVESCIVQKLRGWKFPRPKGNVAVKVTYPFSLKRMNQG